MADFQLIRMEMKNVLIVDDHAVVRTGLKLLLHDFYQGLKIYEASNGDEVMREFKLHKIDLLVMDIHMANTDSIGLVELISIKYPKTYTLIFSMLPEKIYGKRMLKAGARGYLPKESTLDEIKKAFDLVLQQKTYLSQNFIEILAGQVSTDNTLNPFEILSHREFEIVNLLLSGLSINAIAQTLNLKPSTVGTYKIRVFEKLKIKSVFELKDLAMLFNFNHHSIDY